VAVKNKAQRWVFAGIKIEQKNWFVIRRMVGYGRHDTDRELCLLNKLYGYLRLYVNFFQLNQSINNKSPATDISKKL